MPAKKGSNGQSQLYLSIWTTIKPIIATLVEHLMDSTSMVVMTPKVNVYGSKVKFSNAPMGLKFDMDDP